MNLQCRQHSWTLHLHDRRHYNFTNVYNIGNILLKTILLPLKDTSARNLMQNTPHIRRMYLHQLKIPIIFYSMNATGNYPLIIILILGV